MSHRKFVYWAIVPNAKLLRPAEVIVEFWVALVGLWALFHWLSVFLLNIPFAVTAKIQLGLLVLSVAFVLRGRGAVLPIGVDNTERNFRGPEGCRNHKAPVLPLVTMGCATAVAAGCAIWVPAIPYGLLWLLMVGVAFLMSGQKLWAWKSEVATFGCYSSPSAGGAFLLALVLVAALLATGGTIRPDADDAFYLNLVANALDYPEAPFFSSVSLLNVPGVTGVHPSYKASAYESLVAAVAANTGIDHFAIYYNALPLLTTVVWVAAAVLFFSSFGVGSPALAVAASFFVLLLWSGHHYAFGNFAFVRLFQGKAIVALLAAPVIFWSTARYMRFPSWRGLAVVVLAASAVASMSSSGLLVALAALGSAGLVFVPAKRTAWRQLFAIAVAATPVFLVILATFMEARAVPPIPSSHRGQLATGGEVFGGAGRNVLVLIAMSWLVVLPLYAKAGCRLGTVQRLAQFGLLTFFLPGGAWLVGTITGVPLFSWRIHWAFPTALIPGLFLSTLAALVPSRIGDGKGFTAKPIAATAGILAFGAWVLAFFLLGSSTDAFELHPLGNLSAPKIVPALLKEAREVHECLPERAYVASSGELAEVLSGMRGAPSFTSLRHYLQSVEYALSRQEYERRERLQALLDSGARGNEGTEADDGAWAAMAATALGVDAVVLSIGAATSGTAGDLDLDSFLSQLISHLQSRGYDCSTTTSRNTLLCVRR